MDAKTAPLAGGTVDLKKKDFTIVMATTNCALPAWWASTVRKILGRAAMCAHHAQQAMVNRQILIVEATNGRKTTVRSIRRILPIFIGGWSF
jgi:hypothetical protein